MHPDPHEVMAQLNASPADRVAALLLIKNDVIGDDEQKRFWVHHGLLPRLVLALQSNHFASNINEKRARQLFPALQTISTPFTDDDTVQLHALQLLASFARAGPAFVEPLFSSRLLDVVLSEHILQNEHPEIVLAALDTIREYVVATANSGSITSGITLEILADIIFESPQLESLRIILSQRASSRDVEAQITHAAYLVRTLCCEERHQVLLADAGILDALARRLASIAMCEGYMLPKADIRADMEQLGWYLPDPAISRKGLDEVLGAIAAIVTDSALRVCKLVYSPSILAVFPNFWNGGSRHSTHSSDYSELPGIRPKRPREPEIMDMLLPDTPSHSRNHGNTGGFSSSGSSFSSRESPSNNGRPSSKLQTSIVSWTPPEENATRNPEADDRPLETPLVPWLIHLLRTSKGTESLMATSVLASLFKTGFAYADRESSMGLLVIPVLLRLLEDAEAKAKTFKHDWMSPEAVSILNIVEEAPAVLARLITDSEVTQKAAYDCRAVKTICKLLKSSYDTPLPAAEARPWSPEDTSFTGEHAECELADEGQNRLVTHRIRVRETTLKAIGALAMFKEDYRKAIVDQDVVPYMIDSLNEFPAKLKQSKDQDSHGSSGNRASKAERNPVSVIVAACYALRMLSRSVKTLRTALVDHSVSKPIFELLRHPQVDVQIAATSCVCNLLPEFSPMRTPLVDAGVLPVLCKHAHSDNASLRLNALWALKHLVDSASLDLKKQCIEELQSGWLVQLICDNTEEEAFYSKKPRTKQQKSTSTTSHGMDEDVEMDFSDEPSRPWFSSSVKRGGTTYDLPESQILQLARQHYDRLEEVEQNPGRQAICDDRAIQEQALDFIRNLIGDAHSGNNPDSASDTAEMIDHLMSTLGQDRLFTILASKLKPKALHPFTRQASISGSNEARVVSPVPKIIEAVIYVLVHIAASVPRHRQLVIAQTDMLKQLAKLFNSQDREVRVALCHLINNLTWQEDMSDANACSQRATELRNLGFLKKLEALGQSDDELDVRERAKSALWQMKNGY